MELDWAGLADEALELLGDLVRIDTTNPPGNETPAAGYVAGVLADAGYRPVVLESAPGRGNVVARLDGRGDHPPLLLFGHLDVVPAEPEHWTHPPFAGVVADGYLWGRGTLDMKYIVAAQLALMTALRRSGAVPDRDIVFAATADEEAAGVMGMKWLLDHHPDLVAAGSALTEFGGFSLTAGRRRFYLCQTAEKGGAWVRVGTSGRPGHGSMPEESSAPLRLARALARLGPTALPHHLSPTARTMLEGLAEADPALAALLSGDTAAAALEGLPAGQARLFNALVRDTASLTRLEAGYMTNVVPATASATLDCRIVPGHTGADLAASLQAVLGEGVDREVLVEWEPSESPLDDPLFEAVKRHLGEYDPEATVLPFLLVAATDGRFLRYRGIPTYGFGPVRVPDDFDFIGLIHSHDERIPVDGFREGVRVLAETVLDYCGLAR